VADRLRDRGWNVLAINAAAKSVAEATQLVIEPNWPRQARSRTELPGL
jgi:hypothetical protein